MKLIFPFVFSVLTILSACDTSPGKNGKSSAGPGLISENSPFVKDTTKMNLIDSICLATNKAMFHKPKHNILDVSHFNQANLKIGYYIDPESGVTRVLISENESRILNIKYFYVKNNLPMQMHYRYWDKNPTPQYVEETYIYFDEDGKMFYAGERKTELAGDEIPAKLKSLDLTIPEKSKEELHDFMMKYWQMAKPLVDKDIAAKAASETSQ